MPLGCRDPWRTELAHVFGPEAWFALAAALASALLPALQASCEVRDHDAEGDYLAILETVLIL